MDWLRSAYTTDMVFRDGDTTQPVTWYIADADALPFPFWTPFASSNWVSRVSEAGDLGEQPGAKPWTNGAKPASGGVGNIDAQECVKLLQSYWENGIPAGEETGPYKPDGQPECCVDGPPPPDVSCDDCTAVPDVDMAVSFTCPGCPDLDGTTWPLTWLAFPGIWAINGQQFLPSCAPPNFGAITVSRVLASAPCELLFDGAQLFCFGMGIISAVATCDGAGNFLYCEWAGSFSGAPDGCDTVPFTARMTVL